jgi:hypothetical protein
MLDTGCWLLVTGLGLLVTCHWLLEIEGYKAEGYRAGHSAHGSRLSGGKMSWLPA